MPSLAQAQDRSDGPAPGSECSHRMRVVGYVQPSARTRLDCRQPLRAVCEHGCGFEAFWRCDCMDESKCGMCSERRRKLIARLVDLGTTQRLGQAFTYFLTLNGPGENEHKRWRQGRGGADRPDCDCHRTWQTMSKGEWNKQESACWNRLRTALSRRPGGLTYIGAVEVQKRGVLHRHVVLCSADALLPEEVGALALAAGYGCVHDLQVIKSASKAAWYVSKYVTKSAGARGEVPWIADVVDRETGEIRPMKTMATFRTWSSAHSWGYTLKGLREIARTQARARAMYLREFSQLLEDEKAGCLAGPTAGSPQEPDPPPE
jgi:hypothetical protein